MSNFINDTRQKQILREEVWFGASFMTISPGADGQWLFVTTDADEVEFNLEIVSSGRCNVKLWSTPTVNFSGIDVAPVNMRLSTTETTNVTTEVSGTILAAGGELLNFNIPPHMSLDINPFKEGAGVVLDVSNVYGIQIINTDVNITDYYLSWFFREL
jgi:hypothetical protein